jgi:hypothetical protein
LIPNIYITGILTLAMAAPIGFVLNKELVFKVKNEIN